MTWLFRSATDITPTHLADEASTQDEEIVETPFNGCAWCGTGEGICAMHTAQMFEQSAHIAEAKGKRGHSHECA